MPNMEKVLMQSATVVPDQILAVGLVSVGGVQRPVSVRTGGFSRAGERCAPPLFNPKTLEVPYVRDSHLTRRNV